MSLGTTTPRISCALPPGPDTPAHVELAEELGYARAWFYDSSAMYLDPWMTLTAAAQRTRTIGLAVGVAVPELRHVTVTASALLTAQSLAPDRLALGLGAGGTGMLMVGKRPCAWRTVIAYAQTLRELFRGELARWDGAEIGLTHVGLDDQLTAAAGIPIVFGVEGPRGEAAAHAHADGLSTVWHTPTRQFDWTCRLVFGTVLDDGEDATSERAFEAAGPGLAPLYHYAYTTGDRAMLEQLPGGSDWAATADALPERGRVLEVWRGHCVALNSIDRAAIPPQAVPAMTLTGTAAHVAEQVATLGESWTEVIYQPSGPDVERELRAFASATIASPSAS